MTRLEATCRAIHPADAGSARAAQCRLDAKTKPRGSLGRLEELACRLAAIVGRPDPAPPTQRAVIVMAADHGVATEGVSAYPAEVTAQMVRNFAAGGAAINVLARQTGAHVLVVDMGVNTSLEEVVGVRHHSLGRGTANFAAGPAMSRDVALRGVEIGIGLAEELHDEGVDLLAVGEMGIGNTTSASALVAALAGAPVEAVTGRGTGVDTARLRHKIATIERAITRNRPDPSDALYRFVTEFQFASHDGCP